MIYTKEVHEKFPSEADLEKVASSFIANAEDLEKLH